MSTVYITEYKSIGGRNQGEDDNIAGSLPPIPGEIVRHTEQDLSVSALNHVFHSETSFIIMKVFGGDVHFNYNDSGTISSGDRDRITPGQEITQAVKDNVGQRLASQVNVEDVV